jgi:NADPH:quinone reductase-like Zn-dependent oxidoreductase
MPGFTAWYGLFVLGEPKEGDTVLVSGAAGAVGSAAGQMAKIAGCRVIGSAGSEEKLAWLRELGFDDAFDYRVRSPREALAELAPDGIDTYFDNVGGDHLEAAIGALRTYGRVVACGSISRYNDAEPAPGPRNMFLVVTKRLRMGGLGVGAGRPPAVPRDDRGGHRERSEGLSGPPSRGEHREDAREGRPRRVTLRCRLFGHRLPRRRRPFFLTERYQRCERCGKRIRLRGR